MARGRMINNKISVSFRVNKLPGDAALLYTWLVSHLDCKGRFFGNPTIIKGRVFPLRSASPNKINNWLELMESLRDDETGLPLLFRYTVNNNVYLEMPGFLGEQKGSWRRDREQPEYPPPPATICHQLCGKKPADCPQNCGLILTSNINNKENEEHIRGNGNGALPGFEGLYVYICSECLRNAEIMTDGAESKDHYCVNCDKNTIHNIYGDKIL